MATLVKWLVISAAVIVFILGAAQMLAKKSVHSEVLIPANPAQIWEVLVDVDAYPEWNPAMKLIEGTVKEGEKVTYEFTDGAGAVSQIASTVRKIIPGTLLNQGGGLPGIITFDHRYILEQLEGETPVTRVTIHEDYRGIYVWFWDPTTVGEAYEKLNQALSVRVVNLVSG